MVQRFLFDRIDAKPAAPAIGCEHHPIAHTLPNETKPALPFVQLAESRTQSALNAPVRQLRPPSTGIIGLCQLCDHCRQYRSGNPSIQGKTPQPQPAHSTSLRTSSSCYSGSANDTISFAARWFDQKFAPSNVSERHANGTTAMSFTPGFSSRGSNRAMVQLSPFCSVPRNT